MYLEIGRKLNIECDDHGKKARELNVTDLKGILQSQLITVASDVLHFVMEKQDNTSLNAVNIYISSLHRSTSC